MFGNIKSRIHEKYNSLSNNKERLEFLYQVQEMLRTKHNDEGELVRNGQISEQQWGIFVADWNVVNTEVAEKIAELREDVFVKDFKLKLPSEKKDAISDAWYAKKLELRNGVKHKADLETIWQ